jgi:hypothetical protein
MHLLIFKQSHPTWDTGGFPGRLAVFELVMHG